MKQIHFILLGMFFLSFSVQSAKIKHFSQENGLSSNRTYSIVQDEIGFMWIGTKNGIDRFDGRVFKSYELTDKNDVKIDLAGRINKTLKDESGNLWAFSNFGAVFIYNKRSDIFELKLNMLDHISNMLPYVNGILPIDPDHFFVFGTFGLCYYDAVLDKFQAIEDFSKSNVRVFEQINDSVYTISIGNTLSILEIKILKGKVNIEIKQSISSVERIQCINRTTNNNSLLIGTNSGKLMMYNTQENSLDVYNLGITGPIRSILLYNNYYYLCTESQGVCYISVNFTSSITELFSLNAKTGLDVNSINQLFIEDNKFWVVSFNKGIFLIDNNLPDFLYVKFPVDDNTFWGNYVNNILEDQRNNIWMGTENGLVCFDTTKKRWKHFPLSNGINGISQFNTLSLAEDVNGNIWAGGILGSRFACVDKNSGEIINEYALPMDKKSTQSGRVYYIYNDPVSNDLFLGGSQSLFSRLSNKDKKLKSYDLNYVNCIERNSKGLLVGTSNGLYLFDEITGLSTRIALSSKPTPVNQYVNVIFRDFKGNFWIGTEGGLFLLNKDLKLLKSYTKRSGLPSNCIYGILIDGRNRVWISSDMSLTCLNPTNDEIIIFNSEVGIDVSQFFPRSAYKTHDGDFLFGTINGFIQFSPDKIDRIQTVSKIVFTDFMIDYRHISPETKGSPLYDLINNTNKLELQYKQNTFSISFSSINFTNPWTEIFEWQLEGYDESWIRDDLTHIARYSNVPKGKYTFKVRLLNKDNQAVIAQKSMEIKIQPPYWASGWSYFVYFSLLVLLVGYVFSKIKKREERKNTFEKIQFFSNTAHELKTPITLVKGPLAKLKEISTGDEKEKNLIQMALNNTNKLYNVVTQILDFEKTDAGETKLYLEPTDISIYLMEKVEQFKQMSDEKNISLNFRQETNTLIVWLDEERMDKIINNLLSNAIKYTSENGKVELVLKANERSWLLEITDSGIGIPSRFQKNIFEPFKRADNVTLSNASGTGLGLMITKKLVNLHNGTISFKSALNKGTSFYISIPIHYSAFDKDKYILASSSQIYETEAQSEIVENNKNELKKKILVVEDNNDLKEFINLILSEKYVIIMAEDGVIALEKLKKVEPDLIISDIMMPNMDGYELCHLIKSNKNTSHIPIILLTALSGQSHQLKGYQLGADNYIAKPFDNEMLIHTVENTIATREALRQNIMHMLNCETNEEFETNPQDKKFIDELVSIINANLNDPSFSINVLSREMAMSRSSLFNKLKLLTGKSPNDFIRFIRLTHAAKILKEKNYTSIADISFSVGIGDEKYFSTAFKKQFGVSPSKYYK